MKGALIRAPFLLALPELTFINILNAKYFSNLRPQSNGK